MGCETVYRACPCVAHGDVPSVHVYTCSLKYFSFVEDGVNEARVLLLFGVGQLSLLCRDW